MLRPLRPPKKPPKKQKSPKKAKPGVIARRKRAPKVAMQTGTNKQSNFIRAKGANKGGRHKCPDEKVESDTSAPAQVTRVMIPVG